MMDKPRCLAVVEDYDGLHTAIRAWVDEQQVTREAIDAVSGLQSGYSGKLLAPVPSKTFGRTSLGLILGALGLDLWVVVNDEKLARVQGRLTKRKRAVLSEGKEDVFTIRISRRMLKNMASRGGKARASKLPAWRRRQISRMGNRKRWRKERMRKVNGGSI
jgi:hypothetical protein